MDAGGPIPAPAAGPSLKRTQGAVCQMIFIRIETG
jgi:hypothetical protein